MLEQKAQAILIVMLSTASPALAQSQEQLLADIAEMLNQEEEEEAEEETTGENVQQETSQQALTFDDFLIDIDLEEVHEIELALSRVK